jgi:Concanavalin A-like lectin/glucanases superfamily
MKRLSILLALLVSLSVASQANAAVPALDGWWPLNENSGTVAHDLSAQHNNGTISAPRWVGGYFGSALRFDGSTTRVDVPDSPALEPASAVSVTAWVKASGPQGQFQYILAKGASSCMAASYGLYTSESGGLAFYISQNDGVTFFRSPDAGIGVWDGNWHFVVGTYDGSLVHLYVDGHEIGSGTPASGQIGYTLTGGNDLFIGHYDGCPAHDFVGTIDEPTVWSGALTAQQIGFAYQAMVSLHGFVSSLSAFPT